MNNKLVKEVEELLNEVKELDNRENVIGGLEKHYTHKLSERLQKKENEIHEIKRQLDDMIWELRHAESKAFDHYLHS